MSPRSRKRILANLEAIYREAYDRAKALSDENRMLELDWAYQREQLIIEVLLDVRDALTTKKKVDKSAAPTDALEKLARLRKLTGRR